MDKIYQMFMTCQKCAVNTTFYCICIVFHCILTVVIYLVNAHHFMIVSLAPFYNWGN